MTFSEEVAWITGSSTGIGRAAALALAEQGCRVVVHYNRGEDEAREVVEGITSSGGQAALVGGDVSDAGEVERMVGEIEERYGRLDILVNNAGVIRRAPAIEFGEEDWEDVVKINLSSLWYLSQAAARRFVEQGGGGKIVNLASVLSFSGGIVVPSYAATKGAVANLTRALANE